MSEPLSASLVKQSGGAASTLARASACFRSAPRTDV
nr:MAG TPA: hypothetical protein [Caudoviricetes sp.]